jgi:hypothetical protein
MGERAKQVDRPLAMSRPPWMMGDGRALSGTDTSVAVIDSGWDRALADARVLPGGSITHDPVAGLVWQTDDSDRLAHGTHCAQLLLQLAPDARVVPLRVFDADLETSPSRIEAAIDRAIAMRVHVINLSLGTRDADAMPQLYRACERARAARIIVVAATSAHGVTYPAAFDNVLSVGSGWFATPFEHTYAAGELVECLASGRAHAGNDHAAHAGPPSFAAPRIAGMVALLLQQWPALDLDGVRAKLGEYSTSVDSAASRKR